MPWVPHHQLHHQHIPVLSRAHRRELSAPRPLETGIHFSLTQQSRSSQQSKAEHMAAAAMGPPAKSWPWDHCIKIHQPHSCLCSRGWRGRTNTAPRQEPPLHSHCQELPGGSAPSLLPRHTLELQTCQPPAQQMPHSANRNSMPQRVSQALFRLMLVKKLPHSREKEWQQQPQVKPAVECSTQNQHILQGDRNRAAWCH